MDFKFIWIVQKIPETCKKLTSNSILYKTGYFLFCSHNLTKFGKGTGLSLIAAYVDPFSSEKR